MGDIEKYGTGFVRIRQWLKDYPEVQYKIDEMGDFLRIDVFQRTLKEQGKIIGSPEKLPEKLPETLSELQETILRQMRDDPKVTYAALAQSTQKSREAIRRNIQYLKALGLIRRIGPDKGGHWHVGRYEEIA
jgi:ATP-dependent DNA helicase RecG